MAHPCPRLLGGREYQAPPAQASRRPSHIGHICMRLAAWPRSRLQHACDPARRPWAMTAALAPPTVCARQESSWVIKGGAKVVRAGALAMRIFSLAARPSGVLRLSSRVAAAQVCNPFWAQYGAGRGAKTASLRQQAHTRTPLLRGCPRARSLPSGPARYLPRSRKTSPSSARSSPTPAATCAVGYTVRRR